MGKVKFTQTMSLDGYTATADVADSSASSSSARRPRGALQLRPEGPLTVGPGPND
jgi:hypothetical protein